MSLIALPAQDVKSPPADENIPLTNLCIGFWNERGRKNVGISLLVLHSSKQFVFLLDKSALPQSAKGIKRKVLGHFTAGSPLKSSQANTILAFEVEWKHIVGIDYVNPLCLPGRLVLEAHEVVRRELPRMDDVFTRYAPELSAVPSHHRHMSAPNLTAVSPEKDIDQPVAACKTNDLRQTDRSLSTAMPSNDEAMQALSSLQNGHAEHRPNVEDQIRPVDKCHNEDSGNWVVSAAGSSGQQRNGSGMEDRSSSGSVHKRPTPLTIPEGPAICTVEHRLPGGVEEDTGNVGGGVSGSGWSSRGCEANVKAIFEHRSITVNFLDPAVPGALRPVVESDERLLKLYESGLPAWAIYAPQYGIWYRPWVRRVTYMLFILISAFSLVMGFFDLYKNVPYLDKFLRQLGGLFPSSAILQWLEAHVSLRLSILFAYLFGKSELAVQLLRWMGVAGAVIRETLQPVISVLGPPLAVWGAAFRESWGHLGNAALAFARMTCFAAKAVFGPPFAALLDLFTFSHRLLMPLIQCGMQLGLAIVVGPWMLLKVLISTIQASGTTIWQTAQLVGQAFMTAARAIRTGTRMVPAMTTSAKDVGSQVTWWYFVFPFEALEVVKNSAVKVIRALQTLARLGTQMASDIARHRLTLQLRMRRAWRRAEAKVYKLMPRQLMQSWQWMQQKASNKGPPPGVNLPDAEMVGGVNEACSLNGTSGVTSCISEDAMLGKQQPLGTGEEEWKVVQDRTASDLHKRR